MRTSSLKLRAYKHIRRELLAGRLPPGQRISPEGSARQLGMSQTPVREAIGLLESDGLVEQVPGQGAFVCRPSRKDFAALWDVRLIMESYAVARAARRVHPRRLAELERRFAQLRALARRIRDVAATPGARDPLDEEMAVVDARFHLAILRAAENPRVLRIVDNLQILSRLMQYAVVPPVTAAREMASAVREHGRILQALRRHDPKAARAAMRAHLRPNRRLVLRSLRAAAAAAPAGAPVWLSNSVRQDIRADEHVPGPALRPKGKRRIT